MTKARRAEMGLGVLAAILGAAAGVWKEDPIAVWVPVVTSITAAVTAHAAGARYDHLLVEYLRTAVELERLGDRPGGAAAMTDEQLVRGAEHVISVQNEAWMAKLTTRRTGPRRADLGGTVAAASRQPG